MEDFIQVFGWVSLILFVAVALTVVIYAVVVFLSLPIRVLGTKIANEVKVLKEDISENSELKRVRLAKKRIARDKLKNQKLDEKYGEGTSSVAVALPESPEKVKSPKPEKPGQTEKTGGAEKTENIREPEKSVEA
ncbi:MAG: hypothetical protein LBQ05_03320 [Christensenellaceae bacterium]|jgi:hypothetical protein|nr:hypothetical protein [Christensenellaceae bacterium]